MPVKMAKSELKLKISSESKCLHVHGNKQGMFARLKENIKPLVRRKAGSRAHAVVDVGAKIYFWTGIMQNSVGFFIRM